MGRFFRKLRHLGKKTYKTAKLLGKKGSSFLHNGLDRARSLGKQAKIAIIVAEKLIKSISKLPIIGDVISDSKAGKAALRGLRAGKRVIKKTGKTADLLDSAVNKIDNIGSLFESVGNVDDFVDIVPEVNENYDAIFSRDVSPEDA